MVGEVGQPLGVQGALPGGARVVGAAAQQRVVEVAEADLGDVARLGPVAVAPPGVARQRHGPAGGLEHVPVDVDAEVVQGGQRGRELLGLVLLAADRGHGDGGPPGGLQAFAQGVGEGRMGPDLQEEPVPFVGEPVHGGPEGDPVADVPPPVRGVQHHPVGRTLDPGEVDGHLGGARCEPRQGGEQLVLDPVHLRAVVRDLDGQELGEDLLVTEFPGEPDEGVAVPGQGDSGGAVHGGDADPVGVGPYPVLGLLLGEADGEHASGAA